MGTTSIRDLIRLRIASQRLSGPSLDRPAEVVVALGAVGGFGSELFRMGRHSESRRAAFEHHVAEVCVDAARGAR